MPVNPNIFKEYDIRGIYPGEINKEAVYAIARAFVICVRKKSKQDAPKIIVGSDVRNSSAELKAAFIKGCLEGGCVVVDTGIITSPMLYFGVNLLKGDGAAMITASHNPPEYNGIKLTLGQAAPVKPSDILQQIDNEDIDNTLNEEEKNGKKAERMDILPAYVDFMASHLIGSVAGGFHLVADASNGSGGRVLKLLFDKIGVSYWPLYFDEDGGFPNHPPNPLLGDAQQKAKELVIHKGADFGFVLDADGDRIVFLDESGKSVRGDLITALFAEHLAKETDSVFIDSSSSRIIFDIGKEKGLNVKRIRTGHTNIKRAMMEDGRASLAGEMSGHYYFKDFFYADSAIFALIQILNIFTFSRKTLSALIEPYEEYFHSREYDFKISGQDVSDNVLEKIKENYSDGKFTDIDGISVEYPDWWFNLRRSHTEPILRLNIESNSKKLLEEKTKELLKAIKSLVS